MGQLRLLLSAIALCLIRACSSFNPLIISRSFKREGALIYSLTPDNMHDSEKKQQPRIFDDLDDLDNIFVCLDLDCVAIEDSTSLYRSLEDRQRELKNGIGRRYVCRTQRGFLNVHDRPGNPLDVDHILGQLHDGQIVTSTGPPNGSWVQHDGGGWSISVYGGFTWLEQLKD